MEKNISWHKIADNEASIPWQENNLCLIDAGDKKITLARHNGQLYAFAHKCPHASGIMADGYLNGAGQVPGPLHRYRCDNKNGRNSSGEGYFLKTYLLEARPDGLYAGWEHKGFLGIW
jgi:3-phenylpropionate/trans-cinnamate dioxygenase ferredoxin subunit